MACKNFSNRFVCIEKFGIASHVVHLIKSAVPVPGLDEVLVKIKKCAINPSDLLTIEGVYRQRISLPYIPGFEGVGIVVAQGPNVSFPNIGDRVLALKGKGTWQDYTIIPAVEAIPVPREISDDTAAQLYINPLTAWLMLKEELKVAPGSVIIANAGGSSMGFVLAHFSKIFGYKLISVVRNDDYTNELKAAGSWQVINSSKENLSSLVNFFTNDEKANAALECVGGEAGMELAKQVKRGGKMLHYGLLSGTSLPLDAYQMGMQIRPYWLRDWVYRTPIEQRKIEFNKMISEFVRHKIELPVAQVFELQEIKAAVTTAKTKCRKIGKIFLECKQE